MKNKKSLYLVVVDFDPNNTYLEDNYLLGWNSKYDWFDTDTCGYEILTPKGRIKKYSTVTLDIDRWVGIYIGENKSYIKDYSDDGNKEGYNCTLCKLEKDSDGEWIVVPV